MMQPYFDPLWDDLDACERSIERSFDPGSPVTEYPDGLMDDMGRILGRVEASVEGTIEPPATMPEPAPVPPPPIPIMPAPARQEPPLPNEPYQRPWTELKPAPPVRPYLQPHGLTTPPSRSVGHGSAGIGTQTGASTIHWCPEIGKYVDEETCLECDKWDDHGNGYQQCYYEYLEETDQEEAESEGD